MGLRLLWHREAEAELHALASAAPDVAARLGVEIEELSYDPGALEEMVTDRSRHDRVEGKQWFKVQNSGRNVWRARLWRIEREFAGADLRLFYAFDPQRQRLVLLAIEKKTGNEIYDDENHPLRERVCRRYDSLGIPPLPFARR